MNEFEQTALNKIVNYAANHGIGLNIDISSENGAINVQVDYLKDTIKDLAFFFEIGDGDKMHYSSINILKDEYADDIPDLKARFQQIEDNPFQYFIVCDGTRTNVHLQSDIRFTEINDEVLDGIVAFLEGDFARELQEKHV